VKLVKTYVKPTFEFVELRPEERLAGSNCRACQGNNECEGGNNPGGGM
jgi:hypothetical protein